MAIPRWTPRQSFSRQENYLLSRLKRTRKLFAFLRLRRDELFDEAFQTELESMYRDTGAGEEPCPPALLAMTLLLQGYLRVSDAEAVELTVVDLRWQMVLDRLGQDEPPFSQGTLVNFRDRLIRADMDRRLLERTVELAKQTREFDYKKLPKTLRVAVDSAPLEGAGRVEDTVNLLWRGARKVVVCVAVLLGWEVTQVCEAAGVPLLQSSSAKRALDADWSDKEDKQEALCRLVDQLESLVTWLSLKHQETMGTVPLKSHLLTLGRLIEQDLEPQPEADQEGLRIRQGVAEDRQISVCDPEMRHGRKSQSQRIDGYKRHIARDLDSGLILACAVTPANRPEAEATPAVERDLREQGQQIDELYIDRGYVTSSLVDSTLARGGRVVCRPWKVSSGKLFSKEDFCVELENMTVTCPKGQKQPIQLGRTVQFDAKECDVCAVRAQCTEAARGRGRTLSIAEDEALQQRLRQEVGTAEGRAKLRERVDVEHGLAHIVYRQGERARYRGVRKNLFDLRRSGTIQNLETIQRVGSAVAPLLKAA